MKEQPDVVLFGHVQHNALKTDLATPCCALLVFTLLLATYIAWVDPNLALLKFRQKQHLTLAAGCFAG